MSEELLHGLVEFPMLAAFIGYVIWRAKHDFKERKSETAAWRSFLTDRNTKTETAMAAVAASLGQVAEQLGENAKFLERIRERVGD